MDNSLAKELLNNSKKYNDTFYRSMANRLLNEEYEKAKPFAEEEFNLIKEKGKATLEDFKPTSLDPYEYSKTLSNAVNKDTNNLIKQYEAVTQRLNNMTKDTTTGEYYKLKILQGKLEEEIKKNNGDLYRITKNIGEQAVTGLQDWAVGTEKALIAQTYGGETGDKFLDLASLATGEKYTPEQREQAKQQMIANTRKQLTKSDEEMIRKQQLRNQMAYGDTLAGYAGDTAYVLGNMAVPILIGVTTGQLAGSTGASLETASKLSQVGSLASMYETVYGNSYMEAIDEGANTYIAGLYASSIASLEIATELIGGETLLSLMVGRPTTSILGKLSANKVNSIRNKLVKALVASAIDIGGESVEESITGFLDPVVRKTLLGGEDLSITELFGDAYKDAVGALGSSFIFMGLGRPAMMNQVNKLEAKTIAQIQQAPLTVEKQGELIRQIQQITADARLGIAENYDKIHDAVYKEIGDSYMRNSQILKDASLLQKLTGISDVDTARVAEQNGFVFPENRSVQEILDVTTKQGLTYDRSTFDEDIEKLKASNKDITEITPAIETNKAKANIIDNASRIGGKQFVLADIKTDDNSKIFGVTSKGSNNIYINSNLSMIDTLSATYHEIGHIYADKFPDVFKAFKSSFEKQNADNLDQVLRDYNDLVGAFDLGKEITEEQRTFLEEEIFGDQLATWMSTQENQTAIDQSTKNLFSNLREIGNKLSNKYLGTEINNKDVSAYDLNKPSYLDISTVNDPELENKLLSMFSNKETKTIPKRAEKPQKIAPKETVEAKVEKPTSNKTESDLKIEQEYAKMKGGNQAEIMQMIAREKGLKNFDVKKPLSPDFAEAKRMLDYLQKHNGKIPDSNQYSRRKENYVPQQKRKFLKDFERVGYVNVNGAKIETLDDFADLAQIFRDPTTETLRALYVKDNIVVDQSAITSYSVDSVDANVQDFIEEIRTRSKISGADGFYIMHNHPSSDVTPSKEDIRFNNDIRGEAIRFNLNFKGNIIIDHNEYTSLLPNGRVEEHIPLRENTTNEIEKYISQDGWANVKIHNPNDVALVASLIKNGKNYSTLVVLNTKNYVQLLQELPDKYFEKKDAILRKELRELARKNGGAKLAVATTNSKLFNKMTEKNVPFLDVVLYKENKDYSLTTRSATREGLITSRGLSPERFAEVLPQEDKNTRYSKHTREADSEGNELTEEQIEYFKDSKVRDSKGRLMVVYHGSPNEMFYKFDKKKIATGADSFGAGNYGDGFYFAKNKEYSKYIIKLINGQQFGFHERPEEVKKRLEELDKLKDKLKEQENNLVKKETKGKFNSSDSFYSYYNLHDILRDEAYYKLRQQLKEISDAWKKALDEKEELLRKYPLKPIIKNKGFVKQYYLNLKNPLRLDLYVKAERELAKLQSDLVHKYDLSWYEVFPSKEYKEGQKRILNKYGFTERKYEKTGELFDRLGDDYWGNPDLAKMGYDGVISPGMEEIVAFKPNQIKLISNKNPTSKTDIRFSKRTGPTKDSEGRTLSKEQIEWAKDNMVLGSYDEGYEEAENPTLTRLYHGSNTGEFYVFDKEKADVKSDWGAGFYLTDNKDDVDINYFGGGPDFEYKVSKLAEKIEKEKQTNMWDSLEEARKQLSKGEYLIEAYGKMVNPAYVHKTKLFQNKRSIADIETAINDAVKPIQNRYGKRYANKIAKYLNSYFQKNDFKEGIGLNELKDIVDEAIGWSRDKNGELFSNEATRMIIEALGYDGIIDRTVGGTFNNLVGNGLTHTSHYIFFKPNQIKDINNLNPTDSEDIRYSKRDYTPQELDTYNFKENTEPTDDLHRAQFRDIKEKINSLLTKYETEKGYEIVAVPNTKHLDRVTIKITKDGKTVKSIQVYNKDVWNAKDTRIAKKIRISDYKKSSGLISAVDRAIRTEFDPYIVRTREEEYRKTIEAQKKMTEGIKTTSEQVIKEHIKEEERLLSVGRNVELRLAKQLNTVVGKVNKLVDYARIQEYSRQFTAKEKTAGVSMGKEYRALFIGLRENGMKIEEAFKFTKLIYDESRRLPNAIQSSLDNLEFLRKKTVYNKLPAELKAKIDAYRQFWSKSGKRTNLTLAKQILTDATIREYIGQVAITNGVKAKLLEAGKADVDLVDYLDSVEKAEQFSADLQDLVAQVKEFIKEDKDAERAVELLPVAEETADEVATELKKNYDSKLKNFKRQLTNQTLLRSQMTFKTETQATMGGNIKTKLMVIHDNLQNAEIRKKTAVMSIYNILNEFMTDAKGVNKLLGVENWKKDISKSLSRNSEWIKTGVFIGDMELLLPKSMIMSLAMHLENDQNMSHISGALNVAYTDKNGKTHVDFKDGGGVRIPNQSLYKQGKIDQAYDAGRTVKLSYDQVQQIVSLLNDEERQFVEATKKIFAYTTQLINEVSNNIYGYDIATVANYFPIHVWKAGTSIDTFKNMTPEQRAKFDALTFLLSAGWLQDRTTSYAPIYLENIAEVIDRATNHISTFYGYAEALRDNNIIFNTNYEEPVEFGKGQETSTLREALGQLSSSYMEDYNKLTRFIVGAESVKDGGFRSLMAMNTLTFNIGTWLTQPMSFFNTIKYYTSSQFLSAVNPFNNNVQLNSMIRQYYADLGIDTSDMNTYELARAFISMATPMLDYRALRYKTPEIRALYQKGLRELLGAHGIEAFDNIAVTAVARMQAWVIAQDPNIKFGSEEYFKRLGASLTQILVETQPEFSQVNRANMFRSNNGVLRMLSLFGTPANQMFNNFAQSWMEVMYQKREGNKAGFKSALNSLVKSMAGIIVSSILVGLVRALRDTVRTDNDDTEFEQRWVAQSIIALLGPTLILDDVAQLIMSENDFGGMNSYDFNTPETTFMNGFTNLYKKTAQLFNGEVSPAKKTTDMIKALGVITPIDTKGVTRDVVALMKVMSPDAYNSYQLQQNTSAYKKWLENQETDMAEFYSAYQNTRTDVLESKYGYVKADKEKGTKSNLKESREQALKDVLKDQRKVNQYMQILFGYKE